MLANFLNRSTGPSAPPAGRRFDDSFESYVPPSGANASNHAAEVGRVMRRQIVQDWLTTLPESVRPYRMAAGYPERLLPVIERWTNRSAAAMLLDEMIVGDGQNWLEPDLFREISALARHIRKIRFN